MFLNFRARGGFDGIVFFDLDNFLDLNVVVLTVLLEHHLDTSTSHEVFHQMVGLSVFG